MSDNVTVAQLFAEIEAIKAELREEGLPNASVTIELTTGNYYASGSRFIGSINPGPGAGNYKHVFAKTLDEAFAGMRAFARQRREKLDDLNGTLGLPLSTDRVAEEVA